MSPAIWLVPLLFVAGAALVVVAKKVSNFADQPERHEMVAMLGWFYSLLLLFAGAGCTLLSLVGLVGLIFGPWSAA